MFQINTTPRDHVGHVDKTLRLVRETARKKGGILVLPEIWSGGFEYPRIKQLSKKTAEILRELCAISQDHSSLIIGSLPERRSDKLYNSAAVIDNGKILGRYRKQRLFSPMGEDRHFTPGARRKTFATSMGQIAVAICFDLRFPELFVAMRKKGVWLLIVPAQWPEPRCTHWSSLLIARAIENQAYVAGCNRVGTAGGNRFCGQSMIVEPDGKVLTRGSRKISVLTSLLDPSKVGAARKRLPMG